MTKEKILILRLSSIGDIVLCSPIPAALKAQNASREIHFCTRSANADLVLHNPYIDKVHLFDGDLKETIKLLKQENFNSIVDLHKNIRSRKIGMALGLKRHSFKKHNLQKWLLVNFGIPKKPIPHIVERYFQSLKKWNLQRDFSPTEFHFPKSWDHEKCKKSFLPLDFHNAQGYIVLSAGTKQKHKSLSQKRFSELIAGIEQPLILLGGKTEQDLGEALGKEHAHVLNLCGKTSLLESASLIRSSRLVLSYDTGVMHIAAALGIPIFSLWACTRPSLGMAPYQAVSGSQIFLPGDKDPIRPCSKLGNRHRWGSKTCAESLELGEIQKAISNFFSK